ncbi:MAG: phosphatase PAP2 family protein [Elusimicrobia bacterium]|nr:phosphatase PAP2 family protein [Elusimicrobiota bacterium]
MAQLWGLLRGLDYTLFHWINEAWANRWFDAFFPWLTDLDRNKVFLWGALPVALAWWLYAKRGRALKVILAMALAIGVCDAVAFQFLKPLVKRSRPTEAGVAMTLRVRPPGSYGFPSNHACNTFAGAAVLGLAEPPLLWPALAAAALVAYSRVYVGVHFPADVLAGALLGLLIGGAVGAGLVRFGGLSRSSR